MQSTPIVRRFSVGALWCSRVFSFFLPILNNRDVTLLAICYRRLSNFLSNFFISFFALYIYKTWDILIEQCRPHLILFCCSMLFYFFFVPDPGFYFITPNNWDGILSSPLCVHTITIGRWRHFLTRQFKCSRDDADFRPRNFPTPALAFRPTAHVGVSVGVGSGRLFFFLFSPFILKLFPILKIVSYPFIGYRRFVQRFSRAGFYFD